MQAGRVTGHLIDLQFPLLALSGLRLRLAIHVMATKQVARPLVKRNLAFSSSQRVCRPVVLRCPFDFFPTRRRLSQLQPARSTFTAGQRRTFSSTLHTRYAAVEDSIDPRDQPRESDDVDVCIVGGGMSTVSCPAFPIVPSLQHQLTQLTRF